MPDIGKDRSELGPKEPHPAALEAIGRVNYYVGKLGGYPLLIESFSSTAIEGNRLSEVCLGTINRLLENEPVSDRYLLGLAWTLRNMFEDKYKR